MSRRVLLPLVALFLFVLAGSRPAVSADTPAKKSGDKEESWQAIYIGKARVGFAHVVVQTIERDGKQVIVCDNLNQMTITRFGFALKMSVVQSSEEDSEGNMLSFKLAIDNPPTSKVESEGRIANGKLTTTTMSANLSLIHI